MIKRREGVDTQAYDGRLYCEVSQACFIASNGVSL